MAQDIKNAWVYITFSCSSSNCIPTEETINNYVTLPKTADREICVGRSIQTIRKLYFFNELKSGDIISANVYSSTYGYQYVDVFEL